MFLIPKTPALLYCVLIRLASSSKGHCHDQKTWYRAQISHRHWLIEPLTIEIKNFNLFRIENTKKLYFFLNFNLFNISRCFYVRRRWTKTSLISCVRNRVSYAIVSYKLVRSCDCQSTYIAEWACFLALGTVRSFNAVNLNKKLIKRNQWNFAQLWIKK